MFDINAILDLANQIYKVAIATCVLSGMAVLGVVWLIWKNRK